MKAAELLGINNFSTLLPLVVENINHCEIKPYAYRESPASLNDPAYDPYIRALREYTEKEKTPPRSRLPRLQVGSNVWLDLKAKNFSKGNKIVLPYACTFNASFFSLGFDASRGQIYKIVAIDKAKKPWFYTLENLKGKIFPFKQYRESLRLAPADTSDIVWPIQKILAERTVRGQKQVKVRWMFHGREFDQWIIKSTMAVPED